MTRFSALLDACVLVPVSLADALLRLAEAGLYRPVWSAAILTEMNAALETIHPDMKKSGAAKRRSDQMNAAFEDALISEWEGLVDSIKLPDPDDRHVVAAALRGRADIILTSNLKDFPSDRLKRLGLSVQSPDEFLLNQLDLDPSSVIHALNAQAKATRSPRLEVGDVLDRLERCGAHRFAEAARGQLWRLAR